MKGTAAAWLVFLAAATWRWEKDPANAATLPPPTIYIGSAVIFSLLGLVASSAPKPAATFSWALVVAALTTGSLLDKPNPAAPGAAGQATAGSHRSGGGLYPIRGRGGRQETP